MLCMLPYKFYLCNLFSLWVKMCYIKRIFSEIPEFMGYREKRIVRFFCVSTKYSMRLISKLRVTLMITSILMLYIQSSVEGYFSFIFCNSCPNVYVLYIFFNSLHLYLYLCIHLLIHLSILLQLWICLFFFVFFGRHTPAFNIFDCVARNNGSKYGKAKDFEMDSQRN